MQPARSYTFHVIASVFVILLLLFTLSRFNTDRALKNTTGKNKNTTGKHTGTGPGITVSVKKKYADPLIFEAAFEEGTSAVNDFGRFRFVKQDVGLLDITSGKILVGDPVTFPDVHLLPHVFPRGKFPVQLAIADMPGNGRTAFCRIVFSKEAVAVWKPGLSAADSLLPVRSDSLHCYGINAGRALFADASAARQNFDNDRLFDWTVKGRMVQSGACNMALFSTGYGDGCYPVFIGYDRPGNICRIITDFGVVSWWLDPEPAQSTAKDSL